MYIDRVHVTLILYYSCHVSNKKKENNILQKKKRINLEIDTTIRVNLANLWKKKVKKNYNICSIIIRLLLNLGLVRDRFSSIVFLLLLLLLLLLACDCCCCYCCTVLSDSVCGICGGTTDIMSIDS